MVAKKSDQDADARLVRKRLAARLRQQRCRARKKASMMKNMIEKSGSADDGVTSGKMLPRPMEHAQGRHMQVLPTNVPYGAGPPVQSGHYQQQPANFQPHRMQHMQPLPFGPEPLMHTPHPMPHCGPNAHYFGPNQGVPNQGIPNQHAFGGPHHYQGHPQRGPPHPESGHAMHQQGQSFNYIQQPHHGPIYQTLGGQPIHFRQDIGRPPMPPRGFDHRVPPPPPPPRANTMVTNEGDQPTIVSRNPSTDDDSKIKAQASEKKSKKNKKANQATPLATKEKAAIEAILSLGSSSSQDDHSATSGSDTETASLTVVPSQIATPPRRPSIVYTTGPGPTTFIPVQQTN